MATIVTREAQAKWMEALADSDALDDDSRTNLLAAARDLRAGGPGIIKSLVIGDDPRSWVYERGEDAFRAGMSYEEACVAFADGWRNAEDDAEIARLAATDSL